MKHYTIKIWKTEEGYEANPTDTASWYSETSYNATAQRAIEGVARTALMTGIKEFTITLQKGEERPS